MEKVANVLDRAKQLVLEDRREDYGEPGACLKMTAALWSAYLGIDVDETDVCLMNDLQKTSRHKVGKRKLDNLDDKCGYVSMAALYVPDA